MVPITTQDYCTNTLASLTDPQLTDLRTQLSDMDKNSLTNILDILGPIFIPVPNSHRYVKYRVSVY